MASVFQTGMDLVEKVWRTNKNYYIRDIDTANKKCLILFSSNGLYAPNTKEAFEEKIIKNDRYDFKNVTNCRKVEKQFGRIIYVRDLWRAWYIRGINAAEDSIDKLIIKLKELTEGYQVVTAGSSAGGYMAVIAGIALHAEKVLCFSGQFYIEQHLRHKIMQKYEEDMERNKYFDITGLIENTDVPIIYFYPKGYAGDIKQAERVKDCENVIMFAFDYAEHAQTVVPYNFKYLFNMSVKRYRKLSDRYGKREFKSLEFLFITGGAEGAVDCIKSVFHTMRKKFVKKELEEHR